MNAIIVEDEIANREILKRKLSEYCPEIKIVAEYDTIGSALNGIKTHSPDIVFLDIRLPNEHTTGFALLEALGTINFEIVIVSAHREYAADSFDYDVLDYIQKETLMSEQIGDRFKKIVQKVIEKQSNLSFEDFLEEQQKSLEQHYKEVKQVIRESNRIGIKRGNTIRFYNVNDIIYWKAVTGTGMVQCVLSNTTPSTINITKKLADLEELLSTKHFFRIHASHIINLNQVEKVDLKNKKVVMKDQAVLDISVQKFNGFRERISQVTINLLDG